MVFSKLNKPRGDLISMRESNLCILMQPIKFSKEKLRKILENGGDPSSNLGGGVVTDAFVIQFRNKNVSVRYLDKSV